VASPNHSQKQPTNNCAAGTTESKKRGWQNRKRNSVDQEKVKREKESGPAADNK